MLNPELLALLRRIHAGQGAESEASLETLIERGLIARGPTGVAITPSGRKVLGVAESWGDAVVDAMLPGAGAEQAQRERS